MLVDLYKNNNTASKTYGQYYGRVFPRDGLNLKGFARHLSEHGKLASYEMLVLVLQNIVDCMRHLLLEGVPIETHEEAGITARRSRRSIGRLCDGGRSSARLCR